MLLSTWVGLELATNVTSAKQPLMISGSQDGTARLIQIQTKRVLATFSHEGNERAVGTINDQSEATENSVEWSGSHCCDHFMSLTLISSPDSGGFCKTMNWAATGCLGGFLRIWDLSALHVRTSLPWH